MDDIIYVIWLSHCRCRRHLIEPAIMQAASSGDGRELQMVPEKRKPIDISLQKW